jgi:hypothetical protein
MNERAVSETMGFVFAFALVTVTVASVYTFGMAGLLDAQQGEQVNNAERAFDVLADNVADVHGGDAPSRATEISLAGATLSIGEPITVTVEAVNSTNSSDNTTVSMHPRPIVYSGVQDTTIVYVAGAVVRTDGDTSLMSVEPNVVATDRNAVVPFVHTYPSGGIDSLGGDATVLVVAREQSSKLARQFRTGTAAGDPDARVNVTVESPRAAAWGRYFESEGFVAVDGDPSDGTVTYQFSTDRLFVPETGIEVGLRR